MNSAETLSRGLAVRVNWL